MSTKTITFDRETRDFVLEFDGAFVGYAATREDGERILDDLAYERLHRQPCHAVAATPEPEPEPPTPAAVARAIPVRIAPPSIIADASAVAYAWAALLPEREREAHYRAIAKAVGQLMEGVRPIADGLTLTFPSRTRRGLTYTIAEGVCSCEAAGYCWHLAAGKLVDLIEDVQIDREAALDAYEYAA
jgi:hypothetical protein